MKYNMQQLQANIRKLYAIKILRGAGLVMPIMVIFFQDLGLSMTEVFVLQSVFAIGVIVFEVPTGYIGDMMTRKQSLLWGALVIAWGRFTYIAAGTSFVWLLIAEILLAIGYTFISGSDSALLYDTMLALGKEEDFVRVKGKYLGLGNFAEGGGALLGGWLATFGLYTPVFAQVGVAVLTTIIALLLIEPPRERYELEELGREHIKRIVLYALHGNKKIRAILVYSSILSTSTLTFVWMIQPIWLARDISLIYFGILRGVFNASVGVFSWIGHRIEKKWGFE